MSQELIDLTTDLVEIPSFESDDEIVTYLANWLRTKSDATVTVDDANNVIARRGPGTPIVALVGHHDIVAPDSSQLDGDRCRVERREGRLYGRGTADMKGSLAAMAVAFVNADAPVNDQLVFASFADEEVGGVGARHAIDRGFTPDRAVVGEGSTGYSAPGVTDVAVAHKGRRGSTVTVGGKAAHASEPDAGDNAIYHACSVVETLQDIEGPQATIADERVEGSLAVTEIDGGTAWNVIPDHCSITVDERTIPDRRIDPHTIADDPMVDWTVDQDLPPMRCTDDEFIDAVLTAATAEQEGQATPFVKPHATDAGWLSEAGVECLICGAAEPGEAHTEDESVSIQTLETCERIYTGVLDAYARG